MLSQWTFALKSLVTFFCTGSLTKNLTGPSVSLHMLSDDYLETILTHWLLGETFNRMVTFIGNGPIFLSRNV